MIHELETKQLGTIKYDEAEVIFFAKGIPGFEEDKEYVLLRYDQAQPFFLLQSIKSSEIAVVTGEPWFFLKDYEFDLSENDQKELNVNGNVDDLIVVNVIVLCEDPHKITMNLRAPIIINTKEKLGKQIILEKEEYVVKYYLFQEDMKNQSQVEE